jgi:hypothetical protein
MSPQLRKLFIVPQSRSMQNLGIVGGRKASIFNFQV